jgi:hypothetical protein
MPILNTEPGTAGDTNVQNKTITEKPAAQAQDDQTPRYMVKLTLTEEQKKRILEEVKDEWQAIKDEREAAKLEKKWKALDNQYEGKATEDSLRQFNLCRQVTKMKCDGAERLIMKAAWKSDPKFSITARPEFEREGGREVCEAQEDFLDYKLDEDIPFYEPERKTIHSAVVKGTGILKITHEVKIDRKKRDECYQGNPVPVLALDPKTGQPAPAVGRDGKPIVKNTGLEDFIKNHPEAQYGQHAGFVKKLMEGKKITLVVEYDEIVYNDPMPRNIPLEDFYVRTDTEGYDGLCTTKLVVERRKYTWWELKRKEAKQKFYDIDELMYDDDNRTGKKTTAPKDRKLKKDYTKEKYDILECTYYFNLTGKDEDETKIIVWIAEEKWIVVGSIRYPYYAVNTPYIPHYIASIWPGFYQPGMAEYLTDNNIAENAILNFTLEGAMTANIITPIAPKNDPIHTQFLDKRWMHGVPMEADPGKIRFLGEYMPKFDSSRLIQLLEYLNRDDGQVSGVNDTVTGQESQLDPSAPAAKTLALLRQSGINIEDYIDSLMPAFSRIADTILQLYYQMAKEGLKYRPRPERVVGSNPFATLERSDMVARTNIQSQAKSFNFEDANEKAADLSLLQTIRQEPLIARNPDAVYVLLKSVIKGWSKKWRNLVDQILPPLKQFQAQQQQMVAQGVRQYIEAKIQEAKVTGQEPEIDAQQLMALMSDLMAESATPPSPEVVKQREKEQKENPLVQK